MVSEAYSGTLKRQNHISKGVMIRIRDVITQKKGIITRMEGVITKINDIQF